LASQQPDRTFKNAQPREKTYLVGDGHGLALRIQPNGSKTWLFRYRRPITRKETFVSLGGYPDVSLAEARVKASRFRNKLYDGTDPGEERRNDLKEQRLRSFEAVAAAWLEFKRKGWALETYRKAEYVVNEYLIPKLKGKPIASLGTPDAAAALTFVAASSPNLAEKARQYLSGIVRYAVQQGLRADGRGLSLTGVLAPYTKGHIPAITKESGIGPLAYAIANYESDVTRSALTLIMLTAQRPGTIVGARWIDVDLIAAEWHIPAEQMKTKHAHIVPLPSQAVAMLTALKEKTGSTDYLFPALSKQKTPHLHRDSLSKALRTMGFQGLHAAHGFRGMLRTVGRERLNIDIDVLEAQLAHAKKGDVQKAYDRTTFNEQRRLVMQAWADRIDKMREGANLAMS